MPCGCVKSSSPGREPISSLCGSFRLLPANAGTCRHPVSCPPDSCAKSEEAAICAQLLLGLDTNKSTDCKYSCTLRVVGFLPRTRRRLTCGRRAQVLAVACTVSPPLGTLSFCHHPRTGQPLSSAVVCPPSMTRWLRPSALATGHHRREPTATGRCGRLCSFSRPTPGPTLSGCLVYHWYNTRDVIEINPSES